MNSESVGAGRLHPKIFDTMRIRVVSMENGESELAMPFLEEYTQPYGMLHGGAVFTLADSACAAAVATVARRGKKFVTAAMSINYLEPVTGGDTVCRARVLRQGRTVPVEASLWNSDVLVAKATATYTIMD